MSMYDAIIIGAGYGGMSVAALLAHAGYRVALFEAGPLLGGRASAFRDQDGYVWEYGAHSHRLGSKGLANAVFARLGEAIDFVPEADDAQLIFRGRLWPRPGGPLGFLTTPMLPLSSRLALLRLFLRIKRTDPYLWYDATFAEFAGRQSPELEAFLPFFGLMIMCPDIQRVSAGEVIDFVKRYLEAGIGAGEPRGGSSQLFGRLRRHIELSGDIFLNEPVEALNLAGRRVRGVQTARGPCEAPTVIFAARLPLLFEIAPRELFTPDFAAYVDGIENSSGLVMDFITDGPVTPIRGSILGVDVPIWARFQSNSDPGLTPPGRFLSSWGIMLPWGFAGDEEVVQETEGRLKAIISGVFPAFLPRVKRERRLVAGVMNGNVLIPAQAKPHRPEVAYREIEGLFFVGDTVQGDGCSGDISFSSAMKACDLILTRPENTAEGA